LGQKQTFAPQKAMSALPLKADMRSALAHVCFGPKADIDMLSLDHVVSTSKKCRRHGKAEGLGSL
jgi:hypothetical protein